MAAHSGAVRLLRRFREPSEQLPPRIGGCDALCGVAQNELLWQSVELRLGVIEDAEGRHLRVLRKPLFNAF